VPEQQRGNVQTEVLRATETRAAYWPILSDKTKKRKQSCYVPFFSATLTAHKDAGGWISTMYFYPIAISTNFLKNA
jgi:hypothetical protein